MSVDIRPDGSFEVTYVGPYGGLNVQMPENLIKDTESPALNDVILRNAEIRSRPLFNNVSTSSPNSAAIINALGLGSITSSNPNLWAATSTGLYRLNWTTGVWTQDNATFAASSPTHWRILGNTVYGVNGSSHLSSWDARGAFTLDNATVAGNPVGARFIDELDNHLIMALTNENGTIFGNRIRWSASGLPTVWDPAVNVNAGLNDFIEVPDQITGLMMLGRVGYIFRTDGITEVAPTGNGIAPFDFNHLWASQLGIGNELFFALAQYGTTGFFVSRDNVYMVQAFQLQPIGGNARDSIMSDLASAITTGAPVLGSVVPDIDYGFPNSVLVSLGQAPNFISPYLVYYLVIQLSNGTKFWVYSIEDGSWTNFFIPNVSVTGKPVVALQQFVGGSAVPLVLFPTQTIGSNLSAISQFSSTSFNDQNQGSSYSYKVEDVFANRVPTVRRIALTYRDLGVATITLTLTGTDDNQTVQTASTIVTIGNAVATKALMVKLVDLELTAFRPQLSWSRAANGGPVSIARATMIGQVEREVTL